VARVDFEFQYIEVFSESKDFVNCKVFCEGGCASRNFSPLQRKGSELFSWASLEIESE